jgi:non-specific serine/threonine protein kinase/serine/threonine-protein kinase
LATEGRLAEAETLLREALAIRERVLGPEHIATLNSLNNLAELLVDEGQYPEAERLVRQTLATRIHILGADNTATLASEATLAKILNREGRYVEAEQTARGDLAIAAPSLGVHHPVAVEALKELGIALAHRNRYDEASKLFRETIAAHGDDGGRGNGWAEWYGFACVAEAAGRPDDALDYLRKAIDRGYQDGDNLISDQDLKHLRPNPKFQQLVAQLKAPVHG